ncbi:TPA: hypothetical protein ACXGMS_004629 [Escherichia coli]|nr:hypothetical protein [Escherichia coli]AMO51352.1 hypothetical protein AKI40_pA005 [Enterobacter sp. FY-07]
MIVPSQRQTVQTLARRLGARAVQRRSGKTWARAMRLLRREVCTI